MPAPDRWLVLTAHVAPSDPLRDLVAEGLLALGGQAVLEEGGTLSTYVRPPENVEAFMASAEHRIGETIGAPSPPLSWRWQGNEDWDREWRRGLRPRAVTPRIIVKPTWTSWDTSPGETVIEIDPQMAFGTGEHPTTRGCLRLLDRLLRRGDRVLDIGSGSGILSIAAARLGASAVVAVEYDLDANLNAIENVRRNSVDEIVTIVEAMADETLLASLGSFDLILANILSGVIRPLLPALARTLRPQGRLIVSGILETEREIVLADAGATGLALLVEDREAEWWTGSLRTAAWSEGSPSAPE